MSSDSKKCILLIDDEQTFHVAIKYVLKDSYNCFSAYNHDEAKLILLNQNIDLVLLDLNLGKPEEGLHCIPTIRETDPDIDIIILSANTDLSLATSAVQVGANGYLLKDYSAEQLFLTIESALSKREIIHENQHHVRNRQRFLANCQIIGHSLVLKDLMKNIEKIRRSQANVIITGETGTGKELVARHIGAFDNKPFVAVDSATITNSMAESLLFGHERGAFTGAIGLAKGLFEEANHGTIYFDEIANMPLDIQAKLLRVIQEKEIKRLGSHKSIPLNFRVLCATNKDLEKLVKQGLFKHDLLERLNVIILQLPTLRQRKEDVALLIQHFISKFRHENSPSAVSKQAMELLEKYSWPGNVRELSNLIANLCTMITDKDFIEAEDLPEKICDHTYQDQQDKTVHLENLDSFKELDFYRYMFQIEGQVLKDFYRKYGGNITEMSHCLKISRSHLYSKLHSHGIH